MITISRCCRPLSSHGFAVETFRYTEEFLSLQDADAPSCLVFNLDPGHADGLAVQQRLAGDVGMPVIFLSGIVDIPTTVRAMRGGASGFLLKPVDEEQLLLTVRTALVEAHAQWADRQLVRRIRNGYESLTLREREVLPYIVSGFSANKLHMS